jgi:cob(I)alamin adenosyltransferase
MKIFTKTGDKGETSLFGGNRIGKDSLRVEAYGEIDELNSSIGLALNSIQNTEISALLKNIQEELFGIGAGLATPPVKPVEHEKSKIEGENVKTLEEAIDRYDKDLQPLQRFILPGGTEGAARLHLARSICRRAERRVVALLRDEEVNPLILKYMNRLSDLLFVLARTINQKAGQIEEVW